MQDDALDVTTEETYSKEEVIDALTDMAGDAVEVGECGVPDEIPIRWTGNNRREVFLDLLTHGWAVTSVDTNYIWLEKVD